MPLFETGVVQTFAVSTTSTTPIWDPNYTTPGGTTYGKFGVQTAGAPLRDLVVINTGPATIYVGASTSVTSTTGFPVPSGAQLTLIGYTATGGATAGRIYAVTASGSSTTQCGLNTVNGNS